MPSKPELAGAPLVPAGPPVPATSLQHFWQTEALRGVFYPETFGAIGDGVTNDQDALQAAIDAAIAVQGTVQLGLKQYAFDSDLTLRKGKVTLRGRGWWCNIQQHYDEVVNGLKSENLYPLYRTSPLATDPHFHTSGSVLLARKCNGLTREDGVEGGIASNITLEGFALVGDSTTDKTGLLLGGPTFTRATGNNIVRNVFVGHFAVGIDLTVNFFTNVEYCSVRGCKEAVRLGADAETDQPANANYVRGCEFDSNGRVIAAYHGARNHFSDLQVQNNDVLLYVKPTGVGFGTVRDLALTDIYWESQRLGNRLFEFDDAHATSDNVKAAMRLSFERINMNGGNAGVPYFGTGVGAVVEPLFHDVDLVTVSGTIVVPPWVRAPRWEGGRWPKLQVDSARRALIQVQCDLYQGSTPAERYVTDVPDRF